MSGDRANRCVAPVRDICGEGAVWHPEQGTVYWTDINRGLVHRLSPPDSHVRTWHFSQPATALALTSDPARLLLVLGGEILLWDPEGGRRDETLYRLPEWPMVRCNDARVSPRGTLWFGTMENNIGPDQKTLPVLSRRGGLFSLDVEGRVRQWDAGLGIANTVVWTADGDALLFGDTLANAIYRYPYHAATDSVTERTAFFAGFARGLPDGSALDAAGLLWNCRYGGACIARVGPDGEVDAVVETGILNPTTCVFGGPKLQTLYITSAASGELSAGESDGGLFAMETKVSGLPLPRFQLQPNR